MMQRIVMDFAEQNNRVGLAADIAQLIVVLAARTLAVIGLPVGACRIRREDRAAKRVAADEQRGMRAPARDSWQRKNQAAHHNGKR